MKKLFFYFFSLFFFNFVNAADINESNFLDFLSKKNYFSAAFLQTTFKDNKERKIQGEIKANRRGMFKVIYKEPQVSFWDKLGQTKGDVYKLFLFALVILIAIAFDRLIFTYLKQYIEENVVTGFNEFIVRLSYPIGVIVVIWLLKSM